MPNKAAFADTGSAANIEDYNYSDLPSNEWHHYAMVKTGTSYQWYVDGIAEGGPVTINYNETAPLPFFIGGDGDNKPNEHFEGCIDDVVLYRSALTPADVSNVMNGDYSLTVTMVDLGSPVNLTVASTWSDAQPAHANAHYVIPDTGNLRGQTGTSTFPGTSLKVEAGGKFQVRSINSNGETTTVDDLILAGGAGFGSGQFAELAAGTGTDETNVLEGAITQSGATRLTTYGGTINRSLLVNSQISGSGTLQATGAGVTITNAGNTFSGTWETSTSLVFNHPGAVGTADIEVLDSGRLEIMGNWSTSAVLTVADTATTEVDLGGSTWSVANLVFGDATIPGGTYDSAALNALGSNTVFTGPGTLTVALSGSNGPVARWALDEGSGLVATDSSGNGHTGSLLHGPTWSSDATRSSFVSFDGYDDRISTLFTYALSSSDDFTWTWWANKQSSGDTDAFAVMIGNRYGGTGAEDPEFVKMTPRQGEFANGPDENYDYADITPFEWHHYAMVKTGTSYQWYVDGVAEGDPITINYNETSPLPFHLGGDDNDATPGGRETQHFQGFIDDVVLYDRALSPVEVTYVKDGSYTDMPVTWLEDWRLFYFGTTENTGTAADGFDANSDGENNLLEFATGQNPHANTRAQTTAALNGSDLEFRYTRSKAALGDGVTFQVRWSDTLAPGSWSSAGVVDVISPDDPGGGDLEERIATVPGGSGKRFVHLRIDAP